MSKFISKHSGHSTKFGEKNPYEIWEDEKGKYVKIFTKKGYFTFDYCDLEKVKFNEERKNITWCFTRNHKVRNRNVFYVSAHFGQTTRRLHQHIIGHWGHGFLVYTVDHIDRNTLNNRKYNLRIVDKSEQIRNTDKRARKKNTYPLPKEILEQEIPKYVHYVYQKDKSLKQGYREGFAIECHPNLSKTWVSSKSIKVNIRQKLNQTKDKLKELNRQHIQIAGTS